MTMLAAVSASLLAAAKTPDFSGRWKRVESGQRMSLNGPREVVLTIRHEEPVLHYRATGVMGINTPFVEELEFTTDGKSGADSGKLSAEGRWDGQVLVVHYVKNGRSVGTVRISMSPDGKRLTREISLPGKPAFTENYDRQ